MSGADRALLAAAALHAGFQLTVTVLVYPTLARNGPATWSRAHARHSRAIVPLVVVTYGTLVASAAWALASDPTTPVVLTAVAAAACMGVTATLAAPTHGRLTRPDPALLRTLLRVDRVRAVLATLALIAALAA